VPLAYTASFVWNRIQEESEPTVEQIRRILPCFFAIVTLVLSAISLAPPASAQQIDPGFYAGMRWRLIGPYRAGRVSAVAGIPANPAIYYMGTPGGGVWETTDAGTVWKPVFDAEHVAPIGALALAPSDPNIIYVGTGELANQAEGQGVYKSTDGGKTWTHIGLADTLIINSVVVDPRNPDVVLVGAMGSQKPTEARGVYRTTDGGKTWQRVLFKDDQTGVADLALDPNNPSVAYAALWRAIFAPGRKPEPGPGAWIYKTTDGGSTWHQIPGRGLPDGRWGRTGIAVAPGADGSRLYAILSEGLFRSDDAGDTWRRITTDPRVTGNGYFSRVFVDPKNADVVYVMQTSLYRSTDGGRTFIALKGAPGGDDYHTMWIDPQNPNRIILGVDQGATISVDGGKSWTPWYNQPTGQFYHVTAGGGFPYYVYGQQQDSGSAAVPSRSDFGEIRYRDWFSPGGYEFGYIAADPLNPDINYAGGEGGSVVRYDRRTGQLTVLLLHGRDVRTSGNAPMEFSPLDPHALYFGAQYVLKSTDGAVNWQTISPDLTERKGEKEAPGGRRRGNVITTLAASPVAKGEVWVGTGNGLIQLTRDDGATWQNVSPPDLGPHDEISIIEASHFDAATSYAAVDRFEDSHPYFYRTRDFGKTWQPIVSDLPTFGIARVVREDPESRGLLYAGTETGVFVSFDDGAGWQSLQLNLPAASVRDLAVHGNDLAAATFGRALWILDDLTPLRQIDAARQSQGVYLYRPETAMRIRWDRNNDTPLPPEVPAGENPPDGAIIDYYLKPAPAGPITLAIYDDTGKLVRRFSSVAAPPDTTPANVPSYWFARPVALPAQAGMNRFAWNMRYEHPDTSPSELSRTGENYIAYSDVNHAILGKTPCHYPLGPQIVPGTYEIALTVNGKTYRQPLTVRMDPRFTVSQADLVAQLTLEQKIARGMAASAEAYRHVNALHDALSDRQKSLASHPAVKKAADAADEFAKKLDALEEGTFHDPGFAGVNEELAEWIDMIETGDSRPSPSAHEVVTKSCKSLDTNHAAWRKVVTHDLPALNRQLEKAGLAKLPEPPAAASGGCGP
jgi:photosystem II stability/assembly factor-like uncharacterized protein